MHRVSVRIYIKPVMQWWESFLLSRYVQIRRLLVLFVWVHVFTLHNMPSFPSKWDMCICSICLSICFSISYDSFAMCCLISVMYSEGLQSLKMSGSSSLQKKSGSGVWSYSHLPGGKGWIMSLTFLRHKSIQELTHDSCLWNDSKWQ